MSVVSFSPKTISFLRSLKRNNKKTWFEAHRDEYLENLKAPCDSLIAKLEGPLRKEFPGVEVTKRSMTRIYRDIRFSSDKSPYKSYVGFMFRDKRVSNKMGPSLYFGFDPTGFTIGAGIYQFEGLQREAFRQQVTDPVRGREFARVVAQIKRAGLEVEGKALKKTPLGYDLTGPNTEFLLYNGCFAGRETDLLKIFYSPQFADWLVRAFIPMRLFFDWMSEMVRSCPKDPRSFIHVEDREDLQPILDGPF